MIEKLQTSLAKEINAYSMTQNHIVAGIIIDKINELCDAVNTIQKEREAERFEIQEWIGILEAVRKSVNVHEKQIDGLQEAFESIHTCLKYKDLNKTPADPYAEQRKWIGKVCRFFDSDKDDARIGVLSAIQNGMYFIKHTSTAYDYCEPVKPDDDIIYKGE